MDETPSAVTLSRSALTTRGDAAAETDLRKLVITCPTYTTDNDQTSIKEAVPPHESNQHRTTDDLIFAVAENEKTLRRSLTFFDLPGEIHNRIYDLVVLASDPDQPDRIVNHEACRFLPGFAFANRQMRAELLPLYTLRRNCGFTFYSTEDISGIKDWVQSVKPYPNLMGSFWVSITCRLQVQQGTG